MFFLSTALLLGASVLSVRAQTTITSAPATTPTIGKTPLPLTDYNFHWPNLPEQVMPFNVGRGPQSGYNVCNSTTEGPNSLCQTLFFNTIDDFCLWSSPKPNGEIGNIEGDVVAYCTKPGYGTRLIPPGTLTAVQFIRAPGYIQITGLFDQSKLNMKASDSGGELDPHGDDFFGNPLGGLVFSNNLPTSKSNTTIAQVKNWNSFVGSNQFCFKACDNTITNPDYCQNRYDTQGCDFNMPAAYAPNVFLSCLGDNQHAAGEGGGIPATSSCTTYTSSLLYPNSATSTSASSTVTKASSTSAASSTPTKSSSGTRAIGQSGVGYATVASTMFVAVLAGMVVVL